MSPSIRWHLWRIRSMTAAEIAFRVRRGFQGQIDRIRWTAASGYSFSRDESRGWFQDFQEDLTPFYFHWGDRGRICQHLQTFDGEGLDRILQSANSIMNHQIPIFGHDRDCGIESIDWHRDPETQRRWPHQQHWTKINVRDGNRVGGVRWVWELNRHHHIVTLAQAYFLTDQPRFANEAVEQIISWIAQNPPQTGVNWTSPLELSIRIINWIWVLALIRRSPALDVERFEMIMAAIQSQVDHIRRYHSNFSSANNHLIGEVAGLALVGLTYPWMRDARDIVEESIGILSREIECQFSPDGVPLEQSTAYMGFALEFYTLLWRLLNLNQRTEPSIWKQRLGAVKDFIVHIVPEEGVVPAIGDGDNGSVVRFDENRAQDRFLSLHDTIERLLRSSAPFDEEQTWDARGFWLFNPADVQVWGTSHGKAVAAGSKAFPQGGYCTMRAGGTSVLYDCGPLGYLSTAAHGHADALSLTLHVRGVPILIDPGTYAYQEGGMWRDYFRSTAAHNTLTINGMDQSEMLGTFLWGRKATTILTNWRSTPDYDYARAEHNGYDQMGAKISRSVLFLKPDLLLVVDRVSSTKKVKVDQYWHFHPDLDVRVLDGETMIVDCDREELIIEMDQHESEIKSYKGSMNPIQGWTSMVYGHKTPSNSVVRSVEGRDSIQWRTFFFMAEGIKMKEVRRSKAVALLEALGED